MEGRTFVGAKWNTDSRSSGWIISRSVAKSMGPNCGSSPKMREASSDQVTRSVSRSHTQ